MISIFIIISIFILFLLFMVMVPEIILCILLTILLIIMEIIWRILKCVAVIFTYLTKIATRWRDRLDVLRDEIEKINDKRKGIPSYIYTPVIGVDRLI